MKTSILSFASKLVAIALAAGLLASGCSKRRESAPAFESKSQPLPSVQSPPPPPGVNVYTSFDVQNGFDNSVAWAVMNDGQAGYRGQAEWFVPNGSGRLNVVDLAMTGKGAINVTVAEDKNGLPGKSLESFLNIPSSYFGQAGHLVLVSEVHPVLNAGIKYWLCVEPADSNTDCSWAYNDQNLAQGFAYDRQQGNWSFSQGGPRNGALSINVVQ